MRFLKLSFTTTGSALFGLDLVLIALIWPLTLWGCGTDEAITEGRFGDLRIIGYPVAALVLLYAMGLYRRNAIVEPFKTAARIPLVVGMGCVLALLLAVLSGAVSPERFGLYAVQNQIEMFGLAAVSLTVAAFLARLVFSVLVRSGTLRRRVLVVGAGQRAYDLLWMVSKEGTNLNYDVAFFADPKLEEIDPRLNAEAGVRLLLREELSILEAAMLMKADTVVIAPDDRRGLDLQHLLDCKKAGFPVVQYLSFIESEIRRIDIKRLDVGWLVFGEGFTFGAVDRFLKRAFDLLVSSVVLLLASPLLLAGMIAIRCEGPGPIFYRQERVTQNGRVFQILKLRTMSVDAEAQGAVWAAAKDSRVTRAGAFLRRVRIDELPQLLNILKGDMSFVGPRPERPMFVAELAEKLPLYNERHMVKAGLTGWAQVNYPYGASIDDARSKLSYDLYYVKNFSILFDFVILLQTMREVFWPSGVR